MQQNGDDIRNASINMEFLNMQENDRQRIARDLHDISLQNLTHLIHKIELSTMYIDKDPIQAKLELSVVSKKLRETIDEIRSVIFDLRPMTFDDLGLKTALEHLLSNMNEDGGAYHITSEINNVSCENNIVLVSIYHLAKEGLENIRKHANANRIIFTCKEEAGNCILNIEDNGSGFEYFPQKDDRHFGILLMKERVKFLSGKIDITSDNSGTKIHIMIPLES